MSSRPMRSCRASIAIYPPRPQRHNIGCCAAVADDLHQAISPGLQRASFLRPVAMAVVDPRDLRHRVAEEALSDLIADAHLSEAAARCPAQVMKNPTLHAALAVEHRLDLVVPRPGFIAGRCEDKGATPRHRRQQLDHLPRHRDLMGLPPLFRAAGSVQTPAFKSTSRHSMSGPRLCGTPSASALQRKPRRARASHREPARCSAARHR